MTRNYFYTIAMMAIMMVAGNNANAQNRGGYGNDGYDNGDMQYQGGRTDGDYRDVNDNGNYRGSYDMNGRNDARSYESRGNDSRYNDSRYYNSRNYDSRRYDRGGYAHRGSYYPSGYRFVDGGYLYGWEGRVRYHEGRWGYLRGRDWYWYDRYYEPGYYFAHPIGHFHSHRVAHRVAGTVATAVVVGSIIGALCR